MLIDTDFLAAKKPIQSDKKARKEQNDFLICISFETRAFTNKSLAGRFQVHLYASILLIDETVEISKAYNCIALSSVCIDNARQLYLPWVLQISQCGSTGAQASICPLFNSICLFNFLYNFFKQVEAVSNY